MIKPLLIEIGVEELPAIPFLTPAEQFRPLQPFRPEIPTSRPDADVLLGGR